MSLKGKDGNADKSKDVNADKGKDRNADKGKYGNADKARGGANLLASAVIAEAENNPDSSAYR